MTNFLLVLSAPSGGGKTTLAKSLLAARPDTAYSVSATTRAPRPGEEHGKAYYFLTRLEFERRVAAGEFLEWAEYAGNLYGTLRSEIDRLMAAGRNPIMTIDVQGAIQFVQAFPEAVLIFLLPPSAVELLSRLSGRGSESRATLTTRVDSALTELATIDQFEYVVVIKEELERMREQVENLE